MGSYATFVVVCPGCVIEITPPQLHMHFEVEFNAGLPPMLTVGEPGVQGLAITGTHAWGTPRAAATSGLLADVHIPNGGMLLIGAKSIMVAAGVVHVVVGAEVAINEDGAAPNVHCNIAPVTTSCAITMTLLRFRKEIQPKSLRVPAGGSPIPSQTIEQQRHKDAKSGLFPVVP